MKKDSTDPRFASRVLEDLYQEQPKLHVAASGEKADLSPSLDLLTYIDTNLQQEAVTAETGAGYSTLLFAAKGCQHTAFCQADGTAHRIRKWADKRELSLRNVTFVEGRTDATLPTTRINGVKLALLDGGTGFPLPIIDYFYLGPAVDKNGVLVVHNAFHAAARVLCDFLREEYYWKQIDSFPFETPGRTVEWTAVFRKVIHAKPRLEWHEQPWSIKHLEVPRKLLRY